MQKSAVKRIKKKRKKEKKHSSKQTMVIRFFLEFKTIGHIEPTILLCFI